MCTSNLHDSYLKEAERRRLTINECIKALDHSSKCTDENCQVQKCLRMKKVWIHFNTCQQRMDQSTKCEVCKNAISLLSYHSKLCCNDSCRIAWCHEIKKSFEQWQTNQYTFLNDLIQFRTTCVATVEKK